MFPFVQMSMLGLPLFLWIYVLGFIAHGVLTSRRWIGHGLSWRQCLAVYLYLLALAIVGGKIFEIVDNFFYYSHNPEKVLAMQGHGWNGVFVVTTLGLLVLLLLWKKPVLRFLDSYALYLPIGIAIGRFGCLLTADGDYGTPTDLPWGMTFKYGYFPTEVPVHPTPLYEIIVMALLFLVLRRFIVDRVAAGWVLVTYLAVYSVERFLAEFIRWTRPFALGLTLAQWACIIYLLIAIILAITLLLRRRREADEIAAT